MFRDRAEAGRRLADRLRHFEGRKDIVVLGLPRGGVPVASEVASALGAPMDVIVVRKLGVPHQPELAMGAIGEGGVRLVDLGTMAMAGVSPAELDCVERRERQELEKRASLFRPSRARRSLEGCVAIIVDDGIATGSTVRAAARVARELGAARVVVAAPVAPPDLGDRLADDADEVVVVETPRRFGGIGEFYSDFRQTTDREVLDILSRAARAEPIAVGPMSESTDLTRREEREALR
jgi:putative phosphoribosyl transferase